MRILVLGGGGFIGSAIVDRFLKDGHELKVFDRTSVIPYRQFSSSEKIEWIKGDMLNTKHISNAVKGTDIVFHLVSFTLPKTSNDNIIYDIQTNLVATIQLLNLMLIHQVKKIAFISSGGTVYGIPKYLPINENHPTDPLVSYGIVKLAIEKYLLMFQSLYGIKATILRVSNPYGPRQRVDSAQGVIATFLHRALNNQTVNIWGDGNIIRDYIYINDVVSAFAEILNYSGSYSVFNIGSGNGFSLNELIDILGNVLGHPIEHHYLAGRSFDVPASVLDNNLAQKELNWYPKTNLHEGILQTMDWMKLVALK